MRQLLYGRATGTHTFLVVLLRCGHCLVRTCHSRVSVRRLVRCGVTGSSRDRVVIDEPHSTVLSTLSLLEHTDVDVMLFHELARHWPSYFGHRAPGCLDGTLAPFSQSEHATTLCRHEINCLLRELRYRERTNDGTDEDLNDGSNVAPEFTEGDNGTREPNMSPKSEESSGVKMDT